MTDREKAIVMAHTGICMLTGTKFPIFHKYIEDIMGRPVQTIELGIGSVRDEITERSKDDFIAICMDEEQEQCGDYISRKKVIDTIYCECSGENLDIDFAKVLLLQRAIKALQPVIPMPKWIPVSERLPENHKDVLIYLKDNRITIGVYNSHKLPFSNNAIGWGVDPTISVHGFSSDDVIAWMPLPEPYKEDAE